MRHLRGEQDGKSIASDVKITQPMIQAGVDILLFFDAETSDAAEYAKRIYRAMAEVSDSES
jgi:hypothetical protein